MFNYQKYSSIYVWCHHVWLVCLIFLLFFLTMHMLLYLMILVYTLWYNQIPKALLRIFDIMMFELPIALILLFSFDLSWLWSDYQVGIVSIYWLHMLLHRAPLQRWKFFALVETTSYYRNLMGGYFTIKCSNNYPWSMCFHYEWKGEIREC